jgi:cardiolipin synthase
MKEYLLAHAATALAAVGALVMMTELGGSRRSSQSTLAWLLAIAFEPFIAIPLFFLLGNRKFPSHAKGPEAEAERLAKVNRYGDNTPPIARVLRTTGVAPPRSGNSFDLLPSGELAYARLMQLIDGATRTVDLTMFILGSDATGHAVVEALAQRASSGVSVRVILDAVGSSGSIRRAAEILRRAGGEVRTFMPLAHSPIRGRTNLRSHRKLAVFDRQHVFAGGMNLATEYMGPARTTPGEPRWRDVSAVSSGAVAADADAMFESDWAFCGGSPRAAAVESAPDDAASTFGDAVVQLVPSGPDRITDTLYDLFLTGIFAANERVALVTPYYVPDELLQHALLLAARRGVRTEVVMPTVSNHRVADMARRSLVRELLAAGVLVRFYPHGMVHAKAMVIDDDFAYVGSPNFDMRSLFLNYENALCVYSPAAIGQVRGFIDGLIAECDANAPDHTEHRVLEQLARFLAPEL